MAIIGDPPTLDSVVLGITSSNTALYTQMHSSQQSLVNSVYNNPYYNSDSILMSMGPQDSNSIVQFMNSMDRNLLILNPNYVPIQRIRTV